MIALLELLKPVNAPSLCLVKRASDMPCPTCGSTRAVKHILAGDLLQALMSNPFVVIIGGLVALWCLVHIVFRRSIQLNVNTRSRRIMWMILIAAFLLNWVYLIGAGI